jgi:hypothetical protein
LIWSRKTLFLTPLHRHIGLRPSITCSSFVICFYQQQCNRNRLFCKKISMSR